MPLHAYTSPRRPPANLDHLLAHPFEIVLALYGIGAGGSTLYNLYHGRGVSRVVDQLQTPAVAGIALSICIGGLFVLRGLFDDSDDLLDGWRMERAGALLSASGWGVYAYVTSELVGPVSWAMSAGFALMFLLRVVATFRAEREVTAAIADHEGGGA